MKITQELRDHLVKAFEMPVDAEDQDVMALIGTKSLSGELSSETIKDLSTTEGERKVTEIVRKSVSGVEEKVDKLAEMFEKMMKKDDGEDGDDYADSDVEPEDSVTDGPSGKENCDVKTSKSSGSPRGQKAYAGAVQTGGSQEETPDIRIKSPLEGFDNSQSSATYEKSSNPMLQKNWGASKQVESTDTGFARTLRMPNQRDKAIAGAYFKHLMTKHCLSTGAPVPRWARKTELDNQIVKHVVNESDFSGPIGYRGDGVRENNADHWCKASRVPDYFRKTILDDTQSGGLEAVPVEFDDAIILTPLLHGKLFPLVTVRPTGARRVEGASQENPDLFWGTPEGTAISEFNTDNFIAAFDNNVYPVVGAISMGRDFDSDSPVAVGQKVIDGYGQRLKQELDNVIATGDGITQPEGIANAPGVAAFVSEGGPGQDPMVGDYENLYFGVPLEYREEASPGRCVFVGTDQSYKNARGIKVNDPNDERRIFGMEEGNYKIFGSDFKVNYTFSNQFLSYVCMEYYIMYRRQGLEVRRSSEGRDLMLSNEELTVVRARYGGSLSKSQAMAKITDAKP